MRGKFRAMIRQYSDTLNSNGARILVRRSTIFIYFLIKKKNNLKLIKKLMKIIKKNIANAIL
jgi:accessory colonization factor AcfC